ncbi:hypothetical protein ACFY8F_31620 [Streptomyces tanashiensis]|uniref:hypothetical protein n=1 Tax=Streptomyces tanashiensis TaxID=67367 RepID=UPI0036AE75E0
MATMLQDGCRGASGVFGVLPITSRPAAFRPMNGSGPDTPYAFRPMNGRGH